MACWTSSPPACARRKWTLAGQADNSASGWPLRLNPMTFPHLASRLAHIAPFHVMELAKMAAELERQGRHIIHMGIGAPDFTAAPPVIEAAGRAMAENKKQKTPTTSKPTQQQAISAHYRKVYGLDVAPSRII